MAAMGTFIVTHGGAAAPSSFTDGCELAAKAAKAILDAGGSALDAAIRAVVLMEDDGRFNAGSGSVLRMDGVSMEMDASVMDSAGRLGAVAAVRDVKNPVLLALAVTQTPHLMLVGDGASAFARTKGFTVHRHLPSDRAKGIFESIRKELEVRDFSEMPAWKNFDLIANWNFDRDPIEALGALATVGPFTRETPCDTVGAVVCDGQGRMAVAASTGGAAPMLRGRVGDTPIVGCGFYAGPGGAVTATGSGEEIIRRVLSLTVYQRIAGGEHPQQACEWGVAQFPGHVDIGLIAVNGLGAGSANNRDMPYWTQD